MGDTEALEASQWRAPRPQVWVQPGACALKAAHFPLSLPWTSFKGQQGSRVQSQWDGARVWTMSLPVWPPVCLVPEVRGPPHLLLLLGSPLIPHRSFSRALHSLSPPQTLGRQPGGFQSTAGST